MQKSIYTIEEFNEAFEDGFTDMQATIYVNGHNVTNTEYNACCVRDIVDGITGALQVLNATANILIEVH